MRNPKDEIPPCQGNHTVSRLFQWLKSRFFANENNQESSEETRPRAEKPAPEKEFEKPTPNPAEKTRDRSEGFVNRLLREAGEGNNGSGNENDGYERMKLRSLPGEEKERGRDR